AAHQAQLAIANGDHRGRSRPSVDESKLARDRTRTKDRDYAVVATRGGDHDLEQALLQSVAAVARVSDHEQRFTSLEVMRCRPHEQLYRQRLRQAPQYGGRFGSPADPPPLKWSDLRYVFDIKEDCNGKEAIQA